MPKEETLFERERGIIIGLFSKRSSQKSIENSMKRPRSVVQNFLRNLEKYSPIQRPGRPSKISIAAKKRLTREASQGPMNLKTCAKSLVSH